MFSKDDSPAGFGDYANLLMAWKAIACATGLLSAMPALAVADSARFAISAQAMPGALKEFAAQAHMQLLYEFGAVSGLRSNALTGEIEKHVALERLLRDTGLKVVFTSADVAAIRVASTDDSQLTNGAPKQTDMLPQEGKTSSSDQFRMAQASQGTATNDPSIENRHEPTGKAPSTQLEEVVVTGTQIHGAEPTSQVSTYSRTSIEGQGFASVKDFVQSLPQNFNGGASDSTVGSIAGGGNSNNAINGTGINLRGLGNDATLVLLNGQRIAPGNWLGNFVDVSLIPLSAIDRVEVMPDSASAIYGSDAVGGVVNFVLRNDLEGAETRLRYGSVTEGDRSNLQAGQAFGHSWDTGSILLAYSYDRTGALSAHDRDFTSLVANPTSLLPQQQTHGVLLNAREDLGSWQLYGDGTFSHRSTDSYFTVEPFISDRNPASVSAYSGNIGARTDISNTVKFEISGSYAASHAHTQLISLLNTGALRLDEAYSTTITSIGSKFDGELTRMRTGPLLFAVGGEYRRETYSFRPKGFISPAFSDDRSISAGFVELHVPLAAPRSANEQGGALELEIADRYERYSDFGNTNNPKVGLVWRALPALRVRASYGTSFVAPVMSLLNPAPTTIQADSGLFFSPPGPDVIYLEGGNPDLKPQKSRNWSFGLELKPSLIAGFQGYATYYDIRYKDRITNALSLVQFGSIFQNEAILGPKIVQRNPSASYVQSLAASPIFTNYGVPNLATVGAIIDNRYQNLSSVDTRGLDLGSSYDFNSPLGLHEIGIDGTYIFQFDNQFSETAPVTSFLNQTYNPVDLRLRARTSIKHGPFSGAAFLNYIDSYHNHINGQSLHVASWTTVDLTASYELAERAGPLPAFTLMFGVNNVANTAPPFVLNELTLTSSAGYAFNYDGANANPLGRFAYVQLLVRF